MKLKVRRKTSKNNISKDFSGTGAILDEFGRKLGIPVNSQKEYLLFGKQTKTFCIKQARPEHCEFISMLEFQKDNINISEHETFEDSDEDETHETNSLQIPYKECLADPTYKKLLNKNQFTRQTLAVNKVNTNEKQMH